MRPCPNAVQTTSLFRRFCALFGWTRSSSVLLGGFFLVICLIVYVWWPLAQEAMAYIDWNGPWWLYMDWLLVGIFAFMTLTIMAHADLRTGCTDRLRRHVRRAGDRIVGHADQPVALLHRRAPAAVDHPGLADRQSFDRPDHEDC